MKQDALTKREREKEIVSQMIALYCKKKHGNRNGLCAQGALLSACNEGKIREVMRFSGPRMIFVHPIIAIKHVMETKKEKKRLE